MDQFALSELAEQYAYLAVETGKKLGKRVETEFTGFDSSVSAPVRDALSVLLLHATRNAVDHGLHGKTEGTIRCRLSRAGDRLAGRFFDDGAGPDLDAISKRAQARGIVSPAVAGDMPDDLKLEWLFEPGFTTTVRATEISGRGIGLDAVRAALASIGGQIKAGVSKETGGFELAFAIPLESGKS